VPFAEGLERTVRWYVDNEWWWRPIKDHDGEFRRYYEEQYGERLK
jgi:dTDP-glucose 4,6-dehydratase